MNDLISVIVPAYNVETEIVRCLDSIAAQTYQNIEILAVDDGSSDATAEILDRYSETHKNVRVIHRKTEASHRHGCAVCGKPAENGSALLTVMMRSSRICMSGC